MKAKEIVLVFAIWINTCFASTTVSQKNIHQIDSIATVLGSITLDTNSSIYFQQWRYQNHSGQKFVYNQGYLADSSSWKNQYLSVESRAGQPEFDNTTPIKEHFGAIQFDHIQTFELGLEFDPILLEKQMREAHLRSTSAAQNTLKILETNYELRPKEEQSWYLSPVDTSTLPKDSINPNYNIEKVPSKWSLLKSIAQKVSENFKNIDWLYFSEVSIEFENTHKYIQNTQKARLHELRSLGVFRASAQTLTKDGMLLEHFYEVPLGQLSHYSNDSLESYLNHKVKEMVFELSRLRNASIGTPYSGPVLLGPKAAAVFIHEVLGHRLEGHRIKDSQDGQTFKALVGQKIIDSQFDLIDNPSQQYYDSTPLNGFYLYDDQAVPSSKTSLIQNGVFQGFLESRSTSSITSLSNGHGRSRLGVPTVSRMANTQLKTAKPISDTELRTQFKKLLKARNLEFGYYFTELTGGFTSTSRGMPQSFKLSPLMAWKVFVEDKPDELVRGLDLVGTPLNSLSKIVAAGSTTEVFNGFCGAESGWVPVSTTAPPLLFEELEIEKQSLSQHLPPQVFKDSNVLKPSTNSTQTISSVDSIDSTFNIGFKAIQIMQQEANIFQENHNKDISKEKRPNINSFFGEIWNNEHKSFLFKNGTLFKYENDVEPQMNFQFLVGDSLLDQSHFQGNYLFESPLQNPMPSTLEPHLFRNFFKMYLSDHYTMAAETFAQKKAWLTENKPDYQSPSPTTKDSIATKLSSCGQVDSLAWHNTLKSISQALQNSSLKENYLKFDFHNVQHFGLMDQRNSAQNLCEYTVIYSAVMEDSLKQVHWDYHRWSSPNLEDFEQNQFLLEAQAVNEHLLKVNQFDSISFYRGPAVFEKNAAGYFFHQALVEPQVKLWEEANVQNQTPEILQLKGRKFLPSSFNVFDLVSLKVFQNQSLYGSYQFDHLGETAMDIQLIHDGKLTTLYSSLLPAPGNTAMSNGHYRYNSYWPGNLIINFNHASDSSEFLSQMQEQISQEGLEEILVFEKFPDQDAFELLSPKTKEYFTNQTSADSRSFQFETPVRSYLFNPKTKTKRYLKPIVLQPMNFNNLRFIKNATIEKSLLQPYAAYSLMAPNFLIELVDVRSN